MLKAGLAITRRLTPCRHLSSKTHCYLQTSSNSLLSPKAASLSCASEDFLAAPSAFTLLVPASPSKYRAAGSNGGKFKCYFIGDSFSDLLTQMYKLVSLSLVLQFSRSHCVVSKVAALLHTLARCQKGLCVFLFKHSNFSRESRSFIFSTLYSICVDRSENIYRNKFFPAVWDLRDLLQAIVWWQTPLSTKQSYPPMIFKYSYLFVNSFSNTIFMA